MSCAISFSSVRLAFCSASLGRTEIHLGQDHLLPLPMFFWTGTLLVLEGFLFLFYVKVGKFHHRDRMLSLHTWRGDEQVLDVGCGRGLLLAGAAKLLASSGKATGIDIWSNEDMGGNSEAATLHNLELEGVSDRCTLLGVPAQEMPFPDGTFDVILSNLCLHNIYDRETRRRAVQQIVRVLKPGGVAILSDYKLTGEYAEQLRQGGLIGRKAVGKSALHFSTVCASSSPANRWVEG